MVEFQFCAKTKNQQFQEKTPFIFLMSKIEIHVFGKSLYSFFDDFFLFLLSFKSRLRSRTRVQKAVDSTNF